MENDKRARIIPVGEIPTDRPLVTLDVDGVINAYDNGTAPSPYQPEVEESPVPYDIDGEGRIALPYKPTGAYGHVSKREYRIQWSSMLMDDLADAADRGLVTLVWLTSWDDEAGLLADELLWPGRACPVIGYIDSKDGDARTTYASKNRMIKAICDHMEEARPDDPMPVISFDDDMPWDDLMWGTRVEFPPFFHGIGTNPRHGITMSQWSEALEIAKAE